MIIRESSGSIVADVPSVDQYFLDQVSESDAANRVARDRTTAFHCTIAHASELTCGETWEDIETNDPLFVLGLGRYRSGMHQVDYLVVWCNFFRKIRSNLGLGPKDFHITLGFRFSDIHEVNKGVRTIIEVNPSLDLSEVHRINHLEILQFIEARFDIQCDKTSLLALKAAFGQGGRPKLGKEDQIDLHTSRLVEHGNYLGYVYQYQQTQDAQALFSALELYREDVRRKYDPKSIAVKNTVRQANLAVLRESQDFKKTMFWFDDASCKLIRHEMPRNFSWVREGKLAGISALRRPLDLTILRSLGFTQVTYFLEDREHFSEQLEQHAQAIGLSLKYVPCVNTRAPSLQDMHEVLTSTLNHTDPVLFGCLGGYGRTGTALACFLCRFEQLTTEQAITSLRAVRPKSIETEEQIRFVRQYSNHCHRSAATEETPSPRATVASSSEVRLIVLVGSPGSGKTTFCDLLASCDRDLHVISSDLTRSTEECEAQLRHTVKQQPGSSPPLVVVDRTNATVEGRMRWINAAELPSKQCICVHLATNERACLDRIRLRHSHPTIKQGGGQRAAKSFFSDFSEPSQSEGFSQVVHLEDAEDVANYLKTWGCTRIRPEVQGSNHDFSIHKFPRTPHLFNLGAATADDRLVSSGDATTLFRDDQRVLVTEKVDGAQLGFSLDPETFEVQAQNRSHIVNKETHRQFHNLDNWIKDHREALYSVLDPHTVLFGEWLVAKHSVSYDHLPDYFLAFDLYDKRSQKFHHRDVLEEKLRDTNIGLVRIIHDGPVDRELLLDLLEQDSQYSKSGSKIEGLYLKTFDSQGFVSMRAKLVRPEFIEGIETHWTKRDLLKNKLAF